MLHTLALIILSCLIRALPVGEGTKYDTIATFLLISMRRYTLALPIAMCLHVSYYEGRHPMFPPDLISDTTQPGFLRLPPQRSPPHSSGQRHARGLSRR